MSTDTHSRLDAESQKDPATLEREIDQQRDSINDIVNALESRLSPGELLDKAMTYAKGNGGEFINNLGSTIKANPVPTLLTSVGLMWMMMGQNRSQPYTNAGMSSTGIVDSLRDKASGLSDTLHDKANSMSGAVHDKTDSMRTQTQGFKDKAADMRSSTSDSMSSARQTVSEKAQTASETMRNQTAKAKSGFQYMLEEQPLALGAIGIAVGALLGATLPATERENRLMGKTSDRITDKVKMKAEQGYAKATEVGQDLADQATNRVKEEADHMSSKHQEQEPQRASRSM
ncbi:MULTISPECIES: DUF3618 domain-containing protein [Pseudomonas]|uniref:Protein of uncharacterized function (DUF3618) n=1 Tax=Pseudomonas luteola TaxID=47886 RepID=A0A2X2EH11_PSELU|nr:MULTISPECIES: DUF3618 domain-containing protein [Pseudomonas]ENA29660.1 hypothetical protein HMPREF1487_07914 [Pseudomonas sp. HPB0071]MBW5413287.1 DUF3618 domain-containing protein [Pseudomonas sp. MAG002Y]SPZ05990.1 Protein of uncharacterised function (DUF3618) [Pseudomonas luteola]